jgi:hypothetical protein
MVTDLLRSRPAAAAAAAQLYVARRNGAESFLPAAGAPITVTSGLIGSWTFGAWAAIATPANAWYLSQAHVCYVETAAGLRALLLELWRSDHVTAIDCCRRNFPISDPTLDATAYFTLDYTARPVLIPAGTQIDGRAATSDSVARAFQVLLAGWDSAVPVWTPLARNWLDGPGRYYPSNTGLGVDVNAGAAWVYGASATVVDPAPTDLLVTEVLSRASGVMFALGAAAVQVGFGPAGAETWCATVPIGHQCEPKPIHPPVLVYAGERLALRAAKLVAGWISVLVKVYDL